MLEASKSFIREETQESFEDKLKVFGEITEEQKSAVACAILGHSKVIDACFGQITCGRCGANLGDTLVGTYTIPEGSFLRKSVEENIANRDKWDSLSWSDTYLITDTFSTSVENILSPEDIFVNELREKFYLNGSILNPCKYDPTLQLEELKSILPVVKGVEVDLTVKVDSHLLSEASNSMFFIKLNSGSYVLVESSVAFPSWTMSLRKASDFHQSWIEYIETLAE
jgi:hypothetical protein